ncbi:Acyl carrier protein 2, mitochondrial [Apiotrichum porosum]|uniref:Acyl carrier protein n=1 Tax=Apiotrichum porosum TaxID=105984 RepID=A0A427YBJ0_9TREE|nr:Acyl carrier protein 2, mitochondrial [Apiotrichum porosum]RSH88529.1 Acyl carrier protein 2, mitochondrial [Apiotrichum porosum]
MFRLALRAAPRFVATQRVAVTTPLAARAYSAAALSTADVTSRVLDVLKSFEKVDAGKLTATASFTTDLGLDSLDAVEVVMAIEEEFAIEIPDAEADAINSVDQAIEYVVKVSTVTGVRRRRKLVL